MIATSGGLATVDIEVEAARPQKPTWGCVSGTKVVEDWFKLEGAEFPDIDSIPTTLGLETNPALIDVATGSVVDAGGVDVEGCEGKLNDNQPFELGFSGVGGEACCGTVASSSQSSASVASTSSTPLSFTLVFVDASSMTLETEVKSSGTAEWVGLIAATEGVDTIDIEVETARSSKPT